MSDARPHGPLTIERIFDAPADLIWQMWTDPVHFSAWYGPTGATISVLAMELRVGGARSVRMEIASPDGPVRMWFTGRHLEIIDNERLVYTESVATENGDVPVPSDAEMPPGHPATTQVRVELEELGGRTRMVLTHVGIPAESPGAIGWAMAIDKLAAYIRHR